MTNYTNHTNNKPLTEEQKVEIRHQVEVLGIPKTQVAKNLGVSHAVVRKYTTPNAEYFVSEEVRKQARELVEKGLSRSAVSKQLGISRTLVGKLIPGTRQELLTDEVKSQLFEMVKSGKYVGAAARMLGIDAGYARNLVEKAKIERGSLTAVLRERVRLGELIMPVAKDLGIGINRAYEAAGSLMNPPNEDQRGAIERRLANGEEPEQISAELGIRLAFVFELQEEPDKFISDGHTMSEATRARAEELRAAGLTTWQIGQKLKLSRQQVGLITPNEKKRQISPIDSNIKRRLVEGIKAGKSISMVARELGINQSYAQKIASAEMPPPTEEEANEIRRLRAEGKTYTEIARLLKTYEGVVTAVLGPRATQLSVDDELVLAKAYASGQTRASIAAEWGISEARAKAIYDSHVERKLVEPRLVINMEDDKNLERIGRLYPEYEAWRTYAIAYYKVVKGNFAIVVTAVHRFFDYLATNRLPTNPADFFLRSNRSMIPSFFEALKKSDHSASINNALCDFLDWVLLQDEFVDIDEDDVPQTLPMFRNPLSEVRRSDHKVRRNSESNKRVMPYFMVHDLRRRIIQGPKFVDWKFAQSLNGKETLSGDKECREWFEVTPDRIDPSDPDCVSRVRTKADGSTVLEMWSPVRIVALILKLQTTARLGQIRMLDSGEADAKSYVDGNFVENKNPMAFLMGQKTRNQGAIREGEDGVAILYFNTNKTSDIGKEGPEKGQECCWPHLDDYRDDPYWLIAKLARWQRKYNPINRPIKWADVPSTRRLRGKSERVCSTYPDTCFLFRTPEFEGMEAFPVAYSGCFKAWQNLMQAYEQLLAEEGKTHEDGSPIELTQNGRALMTPHGLRVSLITHLIVDAGMSLDMMVRIVGHASFLMTLYYVKPGLVRIREALKSATRVLEQAKDHTLLRDLRTMKLESLRDRVVSNAQDIADVIPEDVSLRNALGWLEMVDGICLAGGNTGPVAGDYHIPGCHNGGQPVGPSSKFVNGPTSGGVRNCCRCRWKCTGKKHLVALQATYNNKNFHRSKASEEAIETEKQRFALLEVKAQAEVEGRLFVQVEELQQAERRHLSAMHRMESLAADMIVIHRTIEKVLALPDEPGTLSLVSGADAKTLEAMVENVDSQTLVLTEVCEDIELFPDLDAGTAVFELSRLLDVAFEMEGQPLKIAHLSNEEQLAYVNAVMRELEHRANPDDPRSGRKIVAQAIDRGDSLAEVLGVKSLSEIVPKLTSAVKKSAPILLRSLG